MHFLKGVGGRFIFLLNGLFLSLSKFAFSSKCSNITLFSKKAEEITKRLIGKKVPIFLESALSKLQCGFRKGFITHCYFLQITLFKWRQKNETRETILHRFARFDFTPGRKNVKNEINQLTRKNLTFALRVGKKLNVIEKNKSN